MVGWLGKLAAVSTRRPRLVVGLMALLTLLPAWVARDLNVSTSRTAMVSTDDPAWQRYMRFAEAFGIPEDLLVVVEGDDPAKVRAFVDRLEARLVARPELGQVFCRIDLSRFTERGLLYLEPKDIDGLEPLLSRPELARFRASADSAGRVDALAQLLKAASAALSPGGKKAWAEPVARRMGEVLASIQPFAAGQRPEFDLVATASLAADASNAAGMDPMGYLSTRGGRLAVVFVRPPYTRDEMKVVLPFVAAVRAEAEASSADGVSFGLTGVPASEVDEFEAIRSDTLLTTLLALLGVVALFFLYYRSLQLLLLSLIPLFMGIVWTAAFTQLVFGGLNAMSSIFTLVLVGMGIDFTVHLGTRFLEERRAGVDAENASRQAVLGAGRGLVTGAVTSAGAFVAVGFSGFKGIEELGFVAAFGLIVTLFFSLTVFSALLAWMGPRLPDVHLADMGMGTWTRFVLARPRTLIACAVALSVVAAAAATTVKFDYSLMNLLPEDAESAVLTERLLEERDLSANAVAAVTSSLEEARSLSDRLAKLPQTHRAVSAATFLPEHQDERVAAARRLYGATLSATVTPANIANAVPPLHTAAGRLTAAIEGVSELAFAGGLAGAVDALEEAAERWAAVQEDLQDPESSERTAEGVQAYLDIVAKDIEAGVNVVKLSSERPLGIQDLPPELKRRFVSDDGRYAVYAVPALDVWDHDAMGAYLDAAREIAPELTGFPETFHRNAAKIRDGFVRAALYASIAVVFLLLLDFRRLSPTVQASVPVVLGAVWMLGVMGALGISYNLANILGLPLVIGVGIDNGVHLVHRFRESGSVELALKQTGGAVVLSSLTTMVGFGSLTFATHRGYSSLGLILFIGVGSSLLMAITVLPALLALTQSRASR